MWCPQREEHGFYLTPLYKCDTSPRSNVIHRWVKVDIKARMPKPTGESPRNLIHGMSYFLIGAALIRMFLQERRRVVLHGYL